jgi:GNAT superfamily N-acetyltransferase
MLELRPHLVENEFVTRIRRQMKESYRLVYAAQDGEVAAVAGYRLEEMLNRGPAMYVDDLVSSERVRGKGFGSKLFDWLVQRARDAGCARFHLDSGVHRFEAHRFYLHKGMDITAHHFSMKL